MSIERSAFARLKDARSYAGQARDLATFLPGGTPNSRDFQAIRYCLIVVGEALNSVSVEILAGESLIPWRRVIALRHRLVHDYWRIDEDLVTEIARYETETLIAALDRLIDRMK